ncbi:Ig-like protein group 2 [Paenibacillus cellulosilyticus]|uniref:Ig-like protein group 2 n=1 Tax=Paenibacillus cellulosilyticus TaxID=375489 RepID=A0A2V2Z2Q5_9BACL|nr:phosphodiester glycosidase family protein [Paenibacillus cellulosilyticus]PWW07395.1 Ig-like protein group 2 [Paenibacillus cellulosilyticus]QKS44439.1 phosphodiester glycosidase family protein [Paenibacillus cellulosilyticus]
MSNTRKHWKQSALLLLVAATAVVSGGYGSAGGYGGTARVYAESATQATSAAQSAATSSDDSAAKLKVTYAAENQKVKAGARVFLRDKIKTSQPAILSYAIGNPAIARVESNGLVSGVKAGTTKVVITAESASETVRITVPIEVTAAAVVAAPKYASVKVTVSGKTYTVQTVTVPKGTPVTAGLANKTVGQVQSLRGMATAYRADVAVNGTFFSAYSDPPVPYGNIISNGDVAHISNLGTTIGFRTDGTAVMDTLRIRTTTKRIAGKNDVTYEMTNDKGDSLSWGDVHTAIGAGPRLVVNGEVKINAEAEGFRDPKILTGGGARSGIGIQKDGSIIIATISGATMKQWAAIMLKLGANQAMNLDGGASSGLLLKSKTITAEGRLLSNALLFGSELKY